MAQHLITTVSARGQVVLPKAIRDSKAWGPGTSLSVRETPEGVLLSPVAGFAETRIDDVFGCLVFEGAPKSVEEMDAAILAAARREA